MITRRLTLDEQDSLKTAFIPVDSATHLHGAYFSVAYLPDSLELVQADLYSSLNLAKLGKADGMIAEEAHKTMSSAQIKSLELKINEIELQKEMDAYALKRSKAVA